jgi:uncharacterized protein (UPF0335 family)
MSELQTAPAAGHNSFSKDQIRSIVERIEAIEAEMKERSADRADIYKEASGNGYDVPALRAIVRARREDPGKRAAREAAIDLYRGAIGIE